MLEGTNHSRGLLDPQANLTGWHFWVDGGRNVGDEGLLSALPVGGRQVPSCLDPVDATGGGCSFVRCELELRSRPVGKCAKRGWGVPQHPEHPGELRAGYRRVQLHSAVVSACPPFAMNNVIDRVRASTAVVADGPYPDGAEGGTAFFVAPGIAVTCAHVLAKALKKGSPVLWWNGLNLAVAEYRMDPLNPTESLVELPPFPDAAVLRVDHIDHPVVPLVDRPLIVKSGAMD